MGAFEDHKAHFGPISAGLIDYVTNDVLLSSRYLFTQTSMRIQYAYCTHCNERHRPEERLKHNTQAVCPKCQSSCMVKMSHVGRKYMRDFAYIVYYEKSIIDPTIMTAAGFYVLRDYSKDYKNVETLYRPSCSYVFEMSKSTMFYTGYYDQSKWVQNKSVKSEYGAYQNIRRRYSRDSIRSAVEGTPFQYSCWDQYDEQDMTKFFGLYSKYPCIEYLTKMKYSYFVKAKLYGTRTFDTIRWSGTKVEQILRLKKNDLRRFMEAYPIIQHDEDCALALRLYQLTLKDSDRPAVGDLENIASRISGYWPQLKRMFKFQSVMKSIAFVEKQFKKGKSTHYHDRYAVLQTWEDYLKQCKELQFDLKRLEIVFPHDLHAAHESASSQVKIKLSEIEKRKIAQRSKELERYQFAFNGFIIRAAKSADEIINEGKKLRHCVGGYAQRHANGETNILMIRKFADPDEPFYTMEIKDNKMIQTYGYRNCRPKGDIAELLEVFKKEKLTSRKKKTKSLPQERQEVAV